MYSGVPMAPVALEEATVLQMRATPKSARRGIHVVTACPAGAWAEAPGVSTTSMRTLAGLTSRCTTPALCTTDSPSARSAPTLATSAGGMVPHASRSPRMSPPPTWSMTMAALSPSTTMSCTPTT